MPLDTRTGTEAEIARLIVETLHLEVAPDEIVPTDRLFNDGLGLDSIDALELALAISRRYGVELKSDDDRISAIFGSLRSLSGHIDQHRTK